MGYLHKTLLVFGLSMAIIYLSHAQDGNAPEDYIAAHSCIRKVFDLPQLQWNPDLAKAAQAWADQSKNCKLKRSGKCGESMAAGPNLNGSYAVQMWLDEKREYDYYEHKCKKPCSHYVQTIWKNTTCLGCGRAQCDDGVSWVVVCKYDPPGNIAGEKPF
ncbi:hypothetical protein R6Q57_029460 [Mikania cordata]